MAKNTITLDIPRLGGLQDFELSNKPMSCYKRYVCTTWEGDGLDNGSDTYDIMETRDGEYVAIKT